MKFEYISDKPQTDPVKLASMIRRIRMFSNFTQLDMVNIAKFLSLKFIKSGTVIFREGDTDMAMYFVVTGRVNVVKQSPDADTKITTISQGQSMGEMSLLDTLPYSATVMAETNCNLVVLTRERYDALLKDYPKLAIKLLSQLSKLLSIRLRLTTGTLVSIAGKSDRP